MCQPQPKTEIFIIPKESVIISESCILSTIKALTELLYISDRINYKSIAALDSTDEKAAAAKAAEFAACRRKAHAALSLLCDESQDMLHFKIK